MSLAKRVAAKEIRCRFLAQWHGGNVRDLNYKEMEEHGNIFAPIQTYSFYEHHNPFFLSHHWHEEVEMLYFERGDFCLARDMKPEPVQEGGLVFLNRSELHQIEGKKLPGIHHAIVFDLRMLKFERYDQAQGMIITPLLNGSLLFPAAITPLDPIYPAVLCEYLSVLKYCAAKPPGWYLYAKAALLKMLAIFEEQRRFVQKGGQKQAQSDYRLQEMKKILKYIEEHYKEKIRLDDLARVAGMNAQYFCRFFRRMTGKAPIDYINAYRVEHAAEELLEKDLRIMEIGYENGFDNFSYFIRKFKEYKGMTPKKYREGEEAAGSGSGFLAPAEWKKRGADRTEK